jgi:hypothetical protein
MRKILLTLLVLALLTPSMVCAMPMCAEKSVQGAASAPCAGHHAKHAHAPAKGKIRFVQDCMGVDLISADHAPAFKAPDIAKASSFVIPPAPVAVARLALSDAGSIRGPPPDWPGAHRTRPGVLLITQRLLI